MRSVDNNTKKSIIDAQNAARQAAGLTLLEDNVSRSVGNNGLAVGDTFELTGDINPAVEVKNADGKVTAVYIGLLQTDGNYRSLQSMMGISSMRGYSLTESAENHTRGKQNALQVETVTPEAMEGFDFADVWQPETRDLYDMAALIKADPTIVKGKWQYGAFAVRQIVAKKDSSATSFEKYKAGDKRAMTSKLFIKL